MDGSRLPLDAAKDLRLRLQKNGEQRQAFQVSIETGSFPRDTELAVVFTGSAIRELSALRPAVQELRQLGREIVAKRAEVERLYGELARNLKDAPTIYAAAGRACREFALEEPFPELKADYIALAQVWERLVSSTDGQQSLIAAESGEVKQLFDFLERSNLYLERLDAQLAAIPSAGAESIKQHMDMVRRYKERFDTLR